MKDIGKLIRTLQETKHYIRCESGSKQARLLDNIDETVKLLMDYQISNDEKTNVVFKQNDGSIETECGNCGLYLDKAYSRCPKCQKELNWNSNQT